MTVGGDYPLTTLQRVEAVLRGEKPDRLPFLDRLEVWHKAHQRAGTLPERYQTLSLTEVYRATGMGQQKFMAPYGLRLRGVEVIATFEGQEVFHETEPIFESFPGMWDVVATDRPGKTVTQLITRIGRLQVQHEVLPETVAMGADPYLGEHLIKESADYATVAHILERAEFVPRYDEYQADVAHVGEHGYVVPLLHRIPFQQVLLEYLGEVNLFYALHDSPAEIAGLLELLDRQMVDILQRLAGLAALYVEFPDNLHGGMTNPRLFARYCLSSYQRYTDILHDQGKKVGSHTDGNVKPLLGLLRESGLDVCESISPAPLTPCTFDEIWDTWSGGPLIWGGIPSPLLETRFPERDLENYLDHLLARASDGRIILGIGDLVLGVNSIDRVKYIAERIESHIIN